MQITGHGTWGWVRMLGIKIGAHHLHVSYVVTLAMTSDDSSESKSAIKFPGLGLKAPGLPLASVICNV